MPSINVDDIPKMQRVDSVIRLINVYIRLYPDTNICCRLMSDILLNVCILRKMLSFRILPFSDLVFNDEPTG